jgi:hypothetical protein
MFFKSDDLLVCAFFKDAKIVLRQALDRSSLAVGDGNVLDNPPRFKVQDGPGVYRLRRCLRGGGLERKERKNDANACKNIMGGHDG